MAFLTKSLKNYYLKDLEANLDYLDDGVLPTINAINTQIAIQTIFSRRPDLSTNPSDKESYLYICFENEIESLLKSKLLSILDSYSNDRVIKSLSLHQGYIQPNVDVDSLQGFKNNAEFFNVTYFSIKLNSEFSDDHETFWNSLKEIQSL